MKKLQIIYVPGLGDSRKAGQQTAISLWRLYGVEAEFLPMNWGDSEAWKPKFKILLNRIDELNKKGNCVALVGVSAGASAVINAYAARKNDIDGVVCLSGKINRPEDIGANYRSHNPAFVTSAYDCQNALASLGKADRRRILSRFGIVDKIVAPKDSRIEGARNRVAPTFGHAPSIAFQIIFGAPSFIRFLKRQSNI